MTKILYFLNSTVRGGVEEHILGLLRGLDRSRFEPVLVCPQELINAMAGHGDNMRSIDDIPNDVRAYPVKIRQWTAGE